MIQLIVHGNTEYDCLRLILSKFNVKCPMPYNLRGRGFGDKKGELVTEDLLVAIEWAYWKKPDKIIIVTDKEKRPFCPGEFAGLSREELKKLIKTKHGKKFLEQLPEISFVIADSIYENWILADPDGISKWKNIKKNPRMLVKGTSDSKDALRILNDCMIKNENYDKAAHAHILTKLADFTKPDVQKRSKSLRKFLKETGCLAQKC